MRYLNGLFWCLLGVVLAIFTYGNWKHVEVNLWSGLIADVNLPLLVLLAFLAGFVPMALWHQAVKWRLKQRLATAERSISDLSGAAAATPPTPPPPPAALEPLPPPAAV